MNTHAVLLGIIVVMAIVFYIFSSYSLYDTSVNDLRERKKDRVRCPPKMPMNIKAKNNGRDAVNAAKIVLNNEKPSQNISMYQDDMNINNKGFVNELIYRQVGNKSSVDYGRNQITVPSIPLNDVCDTQNLPIGNIHVNFLMNKPNNKNANLIL